VLIGIFWSSLARYYYFTTAGSWGLWHDEIHLEDVKQMPICLPRDNKLKNRIVQIVQDLQKLDLEPEGLALAGVAAQQKLPKLERDLDNAIFDLYELNAAQRDLVREMSLVGLDLFYRHQSSDAVSEVVRPNSSFGVLTDVEQADNGLAAYLRTFLEIWNDELAPDGEFTWRIFSPPSHAPLLAVAFTTRYKKDSLKKTAAGEDETWQKLLAKLEKTSLINGGTSRIFIDTFFRYVTDREILFIKRNERRFWTCTAAREDAESALTHLMNLEDTISEGKR